MVCAGDATLHVLLESVAKQGGCCLPEAHIRFIFECLANSVHHIHMKGVVHGDLKPKNCTRFFDGRYRLIDFDQVMPRATVWSFLISQPLLLVAWWTQTVTEMKHSPFLPAVCT